MPILRFNIPQIRFENKTEIKYLKEIIIEGSIPPVGSQIWINSNFDKSTNTCKFNNDNEPIMIKNIVNCVEVEKIEIEYQIIKTIDNKFSYKEIVNVKCKFVNINSEYDL